MPLLTQADQPFFFPHAAVTDLDLLRAQMLVESHFGCNRALDVTEYTQIFSCHPSQAENRVYGRAGNFSSVYGLWGSSWQQHQLTYLPIVAGSVEVSYRSHPGSDFVDLVEGQWRLDEHGRLSILTSLRGYEIRVVYRSGIDPASSSPFIVALKLALGQIVEFLASASGKALQSGISEKSVAGEYAVKYGGGSSRGSGNGSEGIQGGIPSQYLLPFKKFAPRQIF